MTNVKGVNATLKKINVGDYSPEQGGIYAGIIRNPENEQQWHLFLGTTTEEAPTNNKYAIAHCAFKGAWGVYGELLEGEFSLNDGLRNTNLLIENEPDNYLANSVAALSIGDHTDFYIPSVAEMNLLAANLRDKLTTDKHWCSSQCSARLAWMQNMNDGSTDTRHKGDKLVTRAVRRILVG